VEQADPLAEHVPEQDADGVYDQFADQPEGDPLLPAVLAELRLLRAAFERAEQRAERDAGLIERLHEENQTLRRGESDGFFASVRTGLVKHHNRLARQASQARTAADERTGALLDGFAADAAELLERVGVVAELPGSGESLDRARHRPVGKVEAAGEHEHLTLAEVHSPVFLLQGNGRVLLKAEVVVAQYPAASV
jgi:molecular chaperone GrpE (heat shock protein)